jgi:hypothetical protein
MRDDFASSRAATAAGVLYRAVPISFPELALGSKERSRRLRLRKALSMQSWLRDFSKAAIAAMAFISETPCFPKTSVIVRESQQFVLTYPAIELVRLASPFGL